MRKLVVPNFAAIGDSAVEQLAAAYDANAADVLLPLPEMDGDPARRALDAAVVSALGLDGETVAAIRRAWPRAVGDRAAVWKVRLGGTVIESAAPAYGC